MTYSVGFRVPQRGGLVGELVQRLADDFEDDTLYRDPGQPPAEHPAAMPAGLRDFAQDGLYRLTRDPQALARALGEVMTEPKPKVWFEEPDTDWVTGGVRLDRRTRMLYDDKHVFINGEAFLAGGRDAKLMRTLADQRRLAAPAVNKASPEAQALLADWFVAGWIHTEETHEHD
jgi:50S ribosomal protein L16 3-hydroxylase